MQQVQEVTAGSTSIWPHILVMEDEESVAKGLEMVLTEEGYTVDLAITGRNALESFHRKPFDLLIADLRLPDIDGMEVIKKVKRSKPDTGVIVITGYSTIPSAVEAMKLGAADYLPKPFTEEEFITAVKGALNARGLSMLQATESAPEPTPAVLEPLPEELPRIQEILSEIRHRFSGNREELIPILQHFQNRLGYIPESALEEIASITRTPAASVYGVVTFYEQFRLQPVGRHIIKVCRGTACHVKGTERILNEIETRFRISPGQTSSDRMFTLETVACFGSCAIAPVVVVDNKVKGRMNSFKTRQVMEDIFTADIPPDKK